MPLLAIPVDGLSLGKLSATAGTAHGPPAAIRLSLDDSVIEDLIVCARSGKSLSLTLGQDVALHFGSKTQHFSTTVDPFITDLYHASLPPKTSASKPPGPVKFVATTTREKLEPSVVTSVAAPAAAAPAGNAAADAAVAALQNSLASEDAKKKDKNTRYIKNGMGLPPPIQQRGSAAAKPGVKSRLLQKNAARSVSASPNMAASASPAVTSVPFSQQQAERTKEVRRPIIHELALGPTAEEDLLDRGGCSQEEYQAALDKVADLENGKWKLRQKAWKELDVWTYDYGSDQDRQTAIDNAVKVYDKMRLNASEPEWDRLLPKHERGKGKILSKLQAKIAEGPKSKPPPKEESEHESDAGKGKAEGMARSSSQQGAKPKKPTEKDAQAKRLLAKPGKVTKPTAPKPKESKPKDVGKFKSSEYINDSDDDQHYVLSASPAKPDKPERATKPKLPAAPKRPREEDASDTGYGSLKKAKKVDSSSSSTSSRDANPIPRLNHTSNPVKKNTSPQKSSPLASSPPTNASDVNDSYNTSSSTSPLMSHLKPTALKKSGNPHAEPVKRHQKNASSTSSLSSVSSNYAGVRKPSVETMDLARKFKMFYVSYASLHRELSESPEPPQQKLEQLIEMDNRLRSMKKKIIAAIQ